MTRSSRAVRRAAFLAVGIGLLATRPARAQTYEVLQPGLFQVGNFWQFDTLSNGASLATTWQIVGSETVSGHNTVVLRETFDSIYVDDMNVYLDPTAMNLIKSYRTDFNPTQHFSTAYSDPLEKIPRYVNAPDVGRAFGHGQSTIYLVENPGQLWTRSQDQAVSFLRREVFAVPAGTFDCYVIMVNETWRYTNGYYGQAQRVYWLNHMVGFVAMDYAVYEYYPTGALLSSSVTSHRLRYFVSAAPDLVVSQGSFTPTTVAAGSWLTVNWREVCLFRTGAAHSSSVYLSADAVFTKDDILLGTTRIPALAANQLYITSASAVISPQIPGGSYNVAVVLDRLDEVAELDESNTFTLTGQLTIISKPDLTVTSGTFSPSALAPGDVINVVGTITNIGGATAPASWTQVYLSPDAVIGAGDYSLITGLAIPSLAPGAGAVFSQSAFVPIGFPEGPFYVGIACDVSNAVDEINEQNNAAPLPTMLLIGRPDLQITGGGFAPALAMPGGAIAVQATVKNAGPLTAAANWVHLYLSPDNRITTTDLLLQQGLHCPVLTSGAVITINSIPTIPPTTPVGTYYVGIVCDVNNEVAESNEANNAAALPGTLVVTTPPDLTVSYLDFAPTSLNAGGKLRFAGFVVNAGGLATTHTCWLEFYISRNADFSPPRVPLCDSIVLPALAGNGVYSLASLERTVYTNVASGAYTVGVVVDRINEISNESNKANNTVWVSSRKLYVGQRPAGAERWMDYR